MVWGILSSSALLFLLLLRRRDLGVKGVWDGAAWEIGAGVEFPYWDR